MAVVHYCGYKPCVNVAHLRLITKAQSLKLRSFGLAKSRKRASGERHGNSKLTRTKVAEIRQLLALGERKSEIARAYGVTQSSIAAIETGKIWRDGHGDDKQQISDIEVLSLRQDYLDALSSSNATSGIQLTSEKLCRDQIYSRRELIDLFSLENTYAIQNVAIVRPDASRFQSVWIFLTGSISFDETDSTAVLSNDIARCPKHNRDLYVSNHRSNGFELVVFHRTWKNEHGRAGAFRCEGNFEFVGMSDTGDQLILQRSSDPILVQVENDLHAFALEHDLEPSARAEGSRYRILGSTYERDAAARAAAIRHHGTRCQACGFSFAERYGSHGDNYIQVHHHKLLASYGERIKVDPVSDMACLCSNCHSMIHRNPHQPLSVEELKEIIDGQRTLRKGGDRR
ncbi:MAG TPA: hypothetical protein V6D22_04455 [Candidatus Obscuribacterales bacterium]